MELKRLDPDTPRPPFSCGVADLDEFFAVDSIDGGRELLSVTYAFFDPDQAVLGYFSLTNDSIKKEDLSQPEARRFFRRVPHRKRYSSMPTVKIGRLGVSQIFQSSGIGTKILDYLKVWFTDGNKTGCRFLVVDASNNARTIQFYARNGFEFLTTEDANDETRIMFFDLKTFRP